jgi:hypothetical protein
MAPLAELCRGRTRPRPVHVFRKEKINYQAPYVSPSKAYQNVLLVSLSLSLDDRYLSTICYIGEDSRRAYYGEGILSCGHAKEHVTRMSRGLLVCSGSVLPLFDTLLSPSRSL